MVSFRAADRNVVLLMGRMGNQFFQYSFARWLEVQTGRSSFFDLSAVGTHGINGPPAFVSAVKERAIRGSHRWPVPAGRTGVLATVPRRMMGPRYIQIDLTPNARMDFGNRPPSWWVGYWQREEYAQAAGPEIARMVGVPWPEGAVHAHEKKRPRPKAELIRVHVRRGDYLGSANELEVDWYRGAVREARELRPDARVEVVSDDAGWCRRELDLDCEFSVFESGSAFADFLALMEADVLVASPSTFSWWAGYLGGAQVLYPRQGNLATQPFHTVHRESWRAI